MLHIQYRDDIGFVDVEVDDCGVSFLNGTAYFTDGNGADHEVPCSEIGCIYREV